MPVFAVTYAFAPNSSALRDQHRTEHRAFLDRALTAGTLLLAGPLDPAAPTGALLLVVAASAEQAEQMVREDPYCVAGAVRAIETHELRVGRVAAEALAALPG